MNTSCPCPNTECRRHGNCTECRSFHERVKTPVYCEKISDTPRDHTGGVNLLDYAACAG